MTVVLLLSSLTVGLVFVDLNTYDTCIEWMKLNVTVPSHVQTLQIVGMSLRLIPLYGLFPTCIAMLWGFRQFKQHYLFRLLLCAFVTGSLTCAYEIIMFDKFFHVDYNLYRLPFAILFISSIICEAYLVASKFKRVNVSTSYSVFHISITVSYIFLASTLFAYLYNFLIINHFIETKGKLKKATVATLTPGIILPLTAIVKYIVLRKSTEIIAPDRAFVLCYISRGASIILYRTMQSGFHNIWLYVSLSLLHGVSNVLSKATLNFRIRLWKVFVTFFNRTCCRPRLTVQALNSPRIRRLNADLETQNILFEYNTIILSQALLTCHLIMNYDVSAWDVIKESLIRVAISLTIDFVFNIISMLIQIHVYDIPMQMIWAIHWRRHVLANAFMIIVFVSHFSAILIKVFADRNDTLRLRNCTTVF
ncbi:uncharacterized protein LOC114532935 [Dendronephthya gigantea]|uniref:uncharacterized protein LOC114532935 n=1 Tax=Dendronephthya gigantea TaxID=151771 RepID=UPI0010696A3B|nr:uncharacterized protein LOC114532935 [Dendronephthya gigantea]